MNNFRNRLYFRQAARVTAVAMLLGLLFSFTQIAIDFRNERNTVHATVTQVLETLQTPAAQASFSLSQYLAGGVVESLLKYQPIYSATLVTEKGELLASRSRPRITSGVDWLANQLILSEGEYSLVLYAQGIPHPIGKMEVRVDASLIAGNFLTRAGMTVVFGFLKNLILAFAISIVFYRTLSRPLTRLAQVLASTDPLRTETALNLDPRGFGDTELSELLLSANRFLESQIRARTSALQQQNAALRRLTAAVENSPAAVAMTDVAGRVFYVNPCFESMTGYRAEEVAGLPLRLPREVLDAVQENCTQSAADGAVWRGDLCAKRKNGEAYWQEAAVALVRGDAGDTFHVWVMTDITERKAASRSPLPGGASP